MKLKDITIIVTCTLPSLFSFAERFIHDKQQEKLKSKYRFVNTEPTNIIFFKVRKRSIVISQPELGI